MSSERVYKKLSLQLENRKRRKQMAVIQVPHKKRRRQMRFGRLILYLIELRIIEV